MFRRLVFIMFDAALNYPSISRFQSCSQIRCNVQSFTHCLFSATIDTLLADPGATMTFVAGGALKPIGGHILSHASATRLFLRKGNTCDGLGNIQS